MPANITIATPTPQERSPRKDRTRLALVQAGQKLFSERPIEIVSIDDIVQAADVGRGSFYNHFADREEFEREIFAEARRELESAIALQVAGESDPAIRTVLGVCTSIRFAHEHQARAKLIVREFIGGTSIRSELNRGLLFDISQGIVNRRFRVPSAEIGVLIVLGLANAALIRSTEVGDLLVKITIGQQMSAAILQALGLSFEESLSISAYAAETAIRAPRRPAKSPHQK